MNMTVRKILKVVVGGLLFCSVPYGSGETKPSLEIRSVQSSVKKDFVFIEVKYKCNLKRIRDVELKIYALLKKGREEKIASGSFRLIEVEKGTDKKHFMIMSDYVKEYGKPRGVRVEMWHEDRILISETKPRPKEKWWKGETINIIVRSDEKVEKLLREED